MGEIGDRQAGEEIWKADLPVIVYINRLQETASLGFTMASGASLNVPISFATAEGLVRDLDLKEVP